MSCLCMLSLCLVSKSLCLGDPDPRTSFPTSSRLSFSRGRVSESGPGRPTPFWISLAPSAHLVPLRPLTLSGVGSVPRVPFLCLTTWVLKYTTRVTGTIRPTPFGNPISTDRTLQPSNFQPPPTVWPSLTSNVQKSLSWVRSRLH